MNSVDYKTVVWQSAQFNDGTDMERIKQMIKDGNFFDIFADDDFIGNEVLYDTEEYLNADETDEKTLEIYQDGKIIYTNGKNSTN